MSRIIIMAYGLVCYVLGVASLVLFILFANNHIGLLLPEYMSLGIDHANTAPTGPMMAFAINVALIVLFGLQHTVMARQSFKSRLVALLPPAAERSTYVLMTAIVIMVMAQYWQPMTGSIWLVENETARLVITGIYYFGWAFTLAATYMLNHNHLFGLQQSFKPDDPDAGAKEFVTPMFYKVVRHPIQTGVLIAMVATPDMTVGRATLAVGMTVYILVGLHYEERDLITEFGDTYRDYKKRVGGLLPRFK
ncbi:MULTISPECIES: methyltransferase family protein [Kordiimonas]|jgi:protein-S-isoprenylcysteine O-methyltransferase Ste14|uniref:methyltransferase family protein n=1 Tax=Kordiimonas TaxID=288021 RepID=UPI00257C3B95|nr:isoprenylcysteine carboxylmethyltransferase family protein [Kordiimonas sp. UBA4487]